MRITSGRYKGRKIRMPQGIRPTQDKVRKAVFDILGGISGCSFLELFAGSGAVGIEALSRGASQVFLIENDGLCLKAIKENLALLKAENALVLPKESLEAVKEFSKRAKKFDIIFLDPPYHRELSKKALQTLGAYDILAHYGFIIIQHFKKENLPAASGCLMLCKQAKYGDTQLSFYVKSEEQCAR